MTRSDIDKAEHYSNTRAALMAAMAAILLIIAAIGFGDEASSMRPWLRHGFWAVMIGLWLIVLATGGGLRLSRAIRDVMNDEVSLINRSKALQAGFWAATLLGLALYFATLRWELGAREAIRILVDGALAVALLRYAWLERAG